MFEELGSGGFATVFRGRDRRTGEVLALKRADFPCGLQRRIEVTALGRARVPGVAQLRDVVDEAGQAWLVMDLVDGKPFPGDLGSCCAWHELSPLVTALLTVLAHLHARGVVHCDLKPSNVFVTPDGRVVVLDLGVARGPGVPEGAIGFTPEYAPPEQHAGEALDARADLFACGVMIWEALTGKHPYCGYTGVATTRLGPTLPADVPESVAVLLRRMVELDREGRPGSSVEALEALYGGSLPYLAMLNARLPDVADYFELRNLFPEHDEFVQLGADMSRCLLERTAGVREALVQELDGMFRAGLVQWTGDAFLVDRVSVDQLKAGLRVRAEVATGLKLSPDAAVVLGWARELAPAFDVAVLQRRTNLPPMVFHAVWRELLDHRLVWRLVWDEPGGERFSTAFGHRWSDSAKRPLLDHVVEALPAWSGRRMELSVQRGPVNVALVRDICAWADDQLSEGQPLAALTVLELCLRRVRADRSVELEVALCASITAATLGAELGDACDAGLLLVEAHEIADGRLTAMVDLLRAARALLYGDVRLAVTLLRPMAAFRDPRLEVWRWGLQHRCLRATDVKEEKRWFEDSRIWAEQMPEWYGKWLGWKGLLKYRLEKFDEAAELHLKAWKVKRGRSEKLSSLHNLAHALLEGGRVAEARRVAATLVSDAMLAGKHRVRAGAVYVLRATEYRDPTVGAGASHGFERSYVEDAARLDQGLAARFALVEAAWWWRAGHLLRARHILARGQDLAARAGELLSGLLLRALAIHLQGEASPVPPTDELVQLVPSPCPLGVEVQIFALLAAVDPRQEWRDRVERRSSEVDRARWGRRAEVLSIDEARVLVGLAPSALSGPWP